MARKKADVLNLFGGKKSTDGGGDGDSGGPQGHDSDWRQKLVLNKEGEAKVSAHNIKTILTHHEDIIGLFKLDEFANRIMICGDLPWQPKGDGTRREDQEFNERTAFDLAAWMGQGSTFRMGVKPVQVMEAVEAISEANKFHPVREYLDRQAWDKEPRLANLFSDYFGAEFNDYTSQVATIFMVSAVARIYQPGCKVDTMLVLEGKQGVGKTSAVRDLFSIPWYAEAMESPNNKDFYQSLPGNWGIEIGELSSFSKAEVHKVKQMLSAQFDTYRPSYGRYARKFPRQCVFVGTTNEDDWNRDYTGARRFLPIRCTEINVVGIRQMRDNLWAEAVHLYKTGQQWGKLPAGAETEQEARYQGDSWLEPIERWLNGLGGESDYPDPVQTGMEKRPEAMGYGDWISYCTTAEILAHALKLDLGKHGRPEQTRVGQIMTRLGWKKERKLRGSIRSYGYGRPPLPPTPAAAPATAEVQP